jgi:hypothetical protein
MNLKYNRLMNLGAAAATGLGLSPSIPALADDMAEENIAIQALPTAVAKTVQTVQRVLGGQQAKQAEKISYEGIVVLYEAEYHKNGEEYEVYVYPNGDLAARHSHEHE